MNHSKIINGFFITLACLLTSCSNPNNAPINAESNVAKPEASIKDKLKTGGLYLFKSKDSTYYVSKILAIDDFAVHVRIYGNKFDKKPEFLSSENLDILIGHSPIDKEGFLMDNPELLKVEEVKNSELEGYEFYLEEMNK